MDQPRKAFLSKGGVNLSEQKRTPTRTTSTSSTSTKTEEESYSDGIIDDILYVTKNRQIDPERAASIITGRIRFLFVRGVRNNKENSDLRFEIDSFRYLDGILFKDLSSIFDSIIRYGSRNNVKLSRVMELITDTAHMIEYVISDEDYKIIKSVLKTVYSAYDF